MAKSDNKPIKKNVCVLFGGVSPEHEVSLRSAKMILDNIDTTKYRVFSVGIRKDGRWLLHQGENWELTEGTWEFNPGNSPAILFPVLHGLNGEDGTIQGLAQLAQLPCVGCDMAACVCAMDKYITKLLAAAVGVRQAAYVYVTKQGGRTGWNELSESLPFPYPVFVKPCKTGSSVGVSKVMRACELGDALKTALSFGEGALIEECIVGREIETAILGGKNPVVSACGEIIANAEFYDYASKYINDNSDRLLPAPIPEEKSRQIQDIALRVFKAIGGSGMSRADFFLTESGDIIFNEINTIPGFTSISMYPSLFEFGGVSKKELITRLIEAALQEKRHG